MQRLGFWPADGEAPQVAADLIRREADLTRELRQLGTDLARFRDPEAALREMRKERMARARARREETRQKRARLRYERALAWRQRRDKEILYLGAGVSAGLAATEGNDAALADNALPAARDANVLAGLMGISLAELRFLAFDRRVAKVSHYRRFTIAKKSGGERLISAPMPRLKRAQYWILDNILARVAVHEAAHGFVPGRSIVGNAAPHVGQAVVVNLDLKDFFPSIEYPRIKGVFRALGYGEQVATVLGLLCTEAPVSKAGVDGETFFIAEGPRHLPQGAPTSPALTNILCRRLDRRLAGAAAKLGFRYTRYADDLTFSADAETRRLVGKLLWRVKQIIADEGFTVHPEKQHVMGTGRRQQVTGLVVNRKLSVDRATWRRFRAVLFQLEKEVEKNGVQAFQMFGGKHWNGNGNVLAALEGYARFVAMVDAEKGAPVLERLRALRARGTVMPAMAAAPVSLHGVSRRVFRRLSGQGSEPWAGWWQPRALPLPEVEKTTEQAAAEKRALKDERRQQEKIREEERSQEGTQERDALPDGAMGRVRMGRVFGRENGEAEGASPSRDDGMREESGNVGVPAAGLSRNELISQVLTVLVLALSMGKPSLFVIGGIFAFVMQKYVLRRGSWPFFIACMIAALFIR